MSSENLVTPYNSKKVWKMCLTASLGSFMLGYNIGVINSTLDVLATIFDWKDDKYILDAVMTGIMPLGAMFSAIFAGSVSSRIGRRKILMVSNLITLLGAVVTIIPFTITFGIGRLISGLSVGIYATIVPLYINETAPTEMSGKMGTLVQIQATSGISVGYASALILPTGNYKSDPLTYWWMVMFGFQICIALFQFLVFKCGQKLETPTWYLNKSSSESALESLKQVYTEESAWEKLQKMRSSKDSELNSSYECNPSYLDLLLCKQNTNRLMRLGYAVYFLQQFSGINAILTFSTSIFGHLGGGTFMSRVYTLVSGVVLMLPSLFVSSFVDQLGRRALLIAGCVGMSVCLLFTGFFAGPLEDWNILFPVLFILLYILFYGTSIGPICWLYSGEILTPRAMSICVAFSRLFFTTVVFTFPLLKELLGLSIVLWVYTGICFLALVYFSVDMIETKGLSKQEIQKLLRKKGK